MLSVHLYGVCELELTSSGSHADPTWDVNLLATFVAPSGRKTTVRGFWDGGATWRVRFSPDEVGEWSWNTSCEDAGLCSTGALACVPYEGENPLYVHGPLRVAERKTDLEHADGTPFFWLGDTAWNGVIRGDDANWDRFLRTRREQQFNVVQFVCCQWRGDAVDEFGEAGCTEEPPIQINPAFFQRLDHRVARINEEGLLGAPVALWALLESDIGRKLPEKDAIRLASYIVARYDAYQVAWLLGGDGHYQNMGVDRWKNIGRAVFETGHDRLVTLHPCGLNWVGEEFRNEEWYDFIGYQSGHVDQESALAWTANGPMAENWDAEPRKPIINLEPNYEWAKGYTHKTLFIDYHVRRGAYWSLLAAPVAGLTYGHDSIWNWNLETGPSEGHGNWSNRVVWPWYTGLETSGTCSMTVMRGIMERLPWTALTPAPELVTEQSDDPKAFVAAARTDDGTVVIYTPVGGALAVDAAALPKPIRLVDPRTGAVAEELAELACPTGTDWLIVCGPGWQDA
jgi:hypothetical protein